MASQTEISSSSASASTSATSAAATTPLSSSQISPTSSTPLVLAFLAVGLAAASVITALGWRRAHLARFRRLDPVTGTNGGRTPYIRFDLEKPKLWDLWTEESPVVRVAEESAVRYEQETAWENIMPVAVIIPLTSHGQQDSSRITDESTGTVDPVPVTLLSLLIFQVQVLARDIARHFRRTIPLETAQRREGEQGVSGGTNNRRGADDELQRCKNLQVMVAIAMPTEGREYNEENEGKTFEYSAGICSVPWNGAGDRRSRPDS